MHGLNIQVFGEKGGLRWAQEWPNQLYWTPLNGRTQILERGGPDLSPEADRASRVTIGHAEGMPLAFANIYADLAEQIARPPGGPPARSALRSVPNGGRRPALHRRDSGGGGVRAIPRAMGGRAPIVDAGLNPMRRSVSDALSDPHLRTLHALVICCA